MNIMLASVLERTSEIGIRRAVGAKRSDIKRQFVIEALTISIVGGLSGILLGALLSFMVALFSGWTIGWSYTAVIISVGVCALVGLVFGIYPAVQAAKLNPIEALRHN